LAYPVTQESPPAKPPAAGLGTVLLKRSLITVEQLAAAIAEQQKSGGQLGVVLGRLGMISEDNLVKCLSREYRIPVVDPLSAEPSAEVLTLVPHALAHRHDILPVSRLGSALTLAIADPSNLTALNEVKFLTGCDVRVVLAPPSAIEKAIHKYYNVRAKAYQEVLAKLDGEKPAEGGGVNLEELERASEEAPVVKLVSTLMSDAIDKRASDIHFEPYEHRLRVRFRIDGVLQDVMEPPMRFKAAIASRIKVLAALDIAERRLPQDGFIKQRGENGKEMNFRVSVLPTVFGESIVLRLLATQTLQLDLSKLGMDPSAIRHFRQAIAEPSGMVLVTGPTGSGKTTTLYSALAALNSSERKIASAEDPVEIYLDGINQVKIGEDIGLTFAVVLRSFLRQDPDVLMVGEIRDYETIEIAVKAALTGHLVLSTLHTNGAPETITRLMNMGIEPFLVATSVHLICAQRLVRRICKECAEVVEVPHQTLLEEGYTPEEAKTVKIMKGKGCGVCNNTGYKGRTGLYEVMEVDDEIKELVLVGASAVELKKKAIERGMLTLRRSGLIKVALGMTTLEEVARETIH
jgi:type IV pilus assembly protein PilB